MEIIQVNRGHFGLTPELRTLFISRPLLPLETKECLFADFIYSCLYNFTCNCDNYEGRIT